MKIVACDLHPPGACRWSRGRTGTGAADGRHVSEASMGSGEVVVVGPGQQVLITFDGIQPVLAVSPLAQCGLDEVLGLAVGLGRVRLGTTVTKVELEAGRAEAMGAIAAAVVGEQDADANAVRGKEGQRVVQEGDGGGGLLIGQELGEGEAGVVVDGDMKGFEATVPAQAAETAFAAHPGLSSLVLSKGDYAYDQQQLLAGSTNGIEVYDRNPSSGALTYLPSSGLTSPGKSPLLFPYNLDGLLIGVNPQSGGGFSFAFDYLAPVYSSAHLSPAGPVVSTGTNPIAGGWTWNTDGADWVYIVNRQADSSSSTGSIGVYQADYGYGLVGPKYTLPLTLHAPGGFVITP